MVRHLRHPLAVIPASPLGRGQLFYIVFLRIMVVGNFERALVCFSVGRLITEALIFLNATIVTVMILTCPRNAESVRLREPESFRRLLLRTRFAGLVALPLVVLAGTAVTRLAYWDHWSGHSGYHRRFGEQAGWRIKPNLKTRQHR